MANAMVQLEGAKAVWLDADQKKISFAFAPGADVDETRKALQKVVERHQPEEMPDCTQEVWTGIECSACVRGVSQPMPSGIRLLNMPGAGVLLEKESCPTASRFWKWQQFSWVKLQARRHEAPQETHDLTEWKEAMFLAVGCGVATFIGFLLEKVGGANLVSYSIVAYVIAYILGAWHPAYEVWQLARKRILDVHFLMLCVAVGAAFIGHWWEGAVLLFLFSFSGALEELTLSRTEKEIRSLFKETPKEATLLTNEGNDEKQVPVESLQSGMRILVRPGEMVPVDAEVLVGSTSVDEATLSGEAIPIDKGIGDTVFSGTMNNWGSVECRVLRPVSESALAKIMNLIREAQQSKAPSQRFTDKFGTRYTYAILGMSCFMFFIWWLVLGCAPFISEGEDKSAFYRAMTLLVVASPCALVLSIPSAILAGIAAGARHGVLFRGGAAVEQLAEVNRVALDKTGTLTTGELQVVRIESFPPGNEQEVEKLAGSLARHSTHPVSRAVYRHIKQQEDIHLYEIQKFRLLNGLGIEAFVGEDKNKVSMARRSLFLESAVAISAKDLLEPEEGEIEVFVWNYQVRGRILLKDELRKESKPMLKELKKRGLALTVLTGDRHKTAEKVVRDLGVDLELEAELKPEGKVAAIRRWVNQGDKVAMVGDGVNDAPSLAAAHIAVGMGVRGSETVLEQADVVLMQDRIENFHFAYELSRFSRKIIKQNLAISLSVIGVLCLSALGSFIPLTIGVIGHEGSTVVVVLNSLRLLFKRP